MFAQERPVWPPADLDQIRISVALLPPGDGAALLDSERTAAAPAFALADLRSMLLPGETLRIEKAGVEPAPGPPLLRWSVPANRRTLPSTSSQR